MRNHPEFKNEQSPERGSVVDNATQTYQKLDEWLAVKENDPIWMIGVKMALRFLVIFLLILLSPFLVIGLFIAFAAVL